MPNPRVHDLLRLHPSALSLFHDAPAWVSAAFQTTPWAVVRRDPSRPNMVAVGIRGLTRAERFALEVPVSAIQEIVPPEALRTHRAAASRRSMPALNALRIVEEALLDVPMPWGPGGSTGFELATGTATMTEGSDLDLILQALQPFDRHDACALLQALGSCESLPDVRVETETGGFSLVEYAHERNGFVLIRTAHGPVLTANPWARQDVHP